MYNKERASKKASKKTKEEIELLASFSDYVVPPTIFRDTPLTTFEAVVYFLKTERNLSYHQIAVLLGRDDRNIWTVCNRAKKKLASKKKSEEGSLDSKEKRD